MIERAKRWYCQEKREGRERNIGGGAGGRDLFLFFSFHFLLFSSYVYAKQR